MLLLRYYTGAVRVGALRSRTARRPDSESKRIKEKLELFKGYRRREEGTSLVDYRSILTDRKGSARICLMPGLM